MVPLPTRKRRPPSPPTPAIAAVPLKVTDAAVIVVGVDVVRTTVARVARQLAKQRQPIHADLQKTNSPSARLKPASKAPNKVTRTHVATAIVVAAVATVAKTQVMSAQSRQKACQPMHWIQPLPLPPSVAPRLRVQHPLLHSFLMTKPTFNKVWMLRVLQRMMPIRPIQSANAVVAAVVAVVVAQRKARAWTAAMINRKKLMATTMCRAKGFQLRRSTMLSPVQTPRKHLPLL